MIKNFFHDVLAELGAIFGDRGVLLIMGFAVIFYAFVYPLPPERCCVKCLWSSSTTTTPP